ncbi:hypothetical protein Tsubulata_051346 [Turnera subulata]|nr:hypothetical protein Tsubulata_051346 [Turnera subulata]
MLHLHDAVQTDLKKLLRNPPLVKIPKITDLISVHPLLGALPSMVRQLVEGSTKEVIKQRGALLYHEGSRPKGIWLIANGVVKWTSKSIRNKHSLHPTFTHGSTLGLYEALASKRYICDMMADSVVLCFFVEIDQMVSVLKSDPAVEDFLWQESAIVLAKLLLPQIFEKMPMQELRAIVAERSVMTTYLKGESVEVPQHSIGLLLEGFIKAHSAQGELIASPAALLPQHGNQSFQNVETSGPKAARFSNQGPLYQVETTSRIIVFDMAAFEADSALMRRSSSFVLVDHPHRPASEHHGLMSWPENLYKTAQQKHSTFKTDRPSNNLSAKAMQLSIFGSMVDARFRSHSFSTSQVKRSYSSSFVKAASFGGRPLVSVRSEGSNTARKNFEERKLAGKVSAPQLQDTNTNQSHVTDYISDESGAEEELVVRIDSPSRLSFRQAS